MLKPCKQALADAGLSNNQIDEVILVGGSTRMPKVQEIVKDFFGKDPNKSVNPDEVVAVGAAIQGGILTGSVSDVLLLDVTPLSLGIETLGGVATKLIERNTTIPTKKSQVFSTAEANQDSVEIHIVQGERELAKDNKSLGQLQAGRNSCSSARCTADRSYLDIDANGILNVTAKDKGTGKEQSIKITNSSGLTEAEIQKMVQDAKEHEAEDKKIKETVEARNKLDGMIMQVEKTLEEHKAKIAQADADELKAALEVAQKDLKEKEHDLEGLKNSYETLMNKAQKVAQELYKQGAGQNPEDKDNNDNNDNQSGPIDTEIS